MIDPATWEVLGGLVGGAVSMFGVMKGWQKIANGKDPEGRTHTNWMDEPMTVGRHMRECEGKLKPIHEELKGIKQSQVEVQKDIKEILKNGRN